MHPIRRALVGRWRTIGLLLGCAALTFTLWVNADQNDHIHALIAQDSANRLEADHLSCDRANEIRAGIRDLARDLNADPETLAIVDYRFAPVDCGEIPGDATTTSTVGTDPEGPP